MIICGDPQSHIQVWTVKDRKLSCRRSSNGMETSRPNLSGIDFYGTESVIAGLYSGSVKKMRWSNSNRYKFYEKSCLSSYLILGHIIKLRHGDGDQVDALQVQDELMVVATSKEENYFLNCK
jgi:hypothetical protein